MDVPFFKFFIHNFLTIKPGISTQFEFFIVKHLDFYVTAPAKFFFHLVGSWFVVLRSWFVVLGSWFVVLTPDTRSLLLDPRSLLLAPCSSSQLFTTISENR